MEEKLSITKDQLNSLLKLSGIEITQDTEEDVEDLISRALVTLERKLNYFNYPMSFFTTEATNVLIVDDTELSIFQLSSMLRKIGMNVYVARSKEEALAEFKKKNFDFLVLDLFMPDYKDGFELIKTANEIRNQGDHIFKIIVISGTDNINVIHQAYQLEIDEFIPKSPQWHERILKFITTSTTRLSSEVYSFYKVNDDICAFTIYKINNEKYIDKIIKEVNANVLTSKQNIIFNLEHIKLFSDTYTSLFSEVYKSTSLKEGKFVLVKPCEEIKKALEYVFLSDAIPTFNTMEEAIEYIEMTSFKD